MKKTGAKAGQVLGGNTMLCNTVLNARNDNYVSNLGLFDELLCCNVSTIPCFLDADFRALWPNLLGLNTLNDVLKNG